MVVRATIGAIVNRLPFSDRIPDRIQTFMGSGASTLACMEMAPEEVPPLATPSQKIRLKMLEKRTVDQSASPGMSSSCENSPLGPDDDGEETVQETDSQSIRHARVESYLNEQHDEFTFLINKNLKEVMQQSHKKTTDDPSWRRLVIELAMARNGEEATSKLNAIFIRASESVCAYVPFKRVDSKTHALLEEYENSAFRIETAELLDQLDYESKVSLLRQLMVDLGMRADADEIINFTRGSTVSEETSMTDKIELLTLLLVRLWFIGLKYFVPITKLLYTKFKENDILLLNNKNLSKLLTVLVRVMEAFEEKLNATGQTSSRPGSRTSAHSSL